MSRSVPPRPPSDPQQASGSPDDHWLANVFYEMAASRPMRRAYRIDDRDDAIQEVTLRLWHRQDAIFGKFGLSRGELAATLARHDDSHACRTAYRAADNRYKDLLKAMRTRKRRFFTCGGQGLDQVLTGANPHEEVQRRELSDRVQAALRKLSETNQAIVRWYSEGIPHAEIGARLGITEGAAKTAHHRALKELRDAMKGRDDPA